MKEKKIGGKKNKIKNLKKKTKNQKNNQKISKISKNHFFLKQKKLLKKNHQQKMLSS